MQTKPTKMDRSYLNLSFLQLHHLRKPTLNRPKSRVKVATKYFLLCILVDLDRVERQWRQGEIFERVYAQPRLCVYKEEEHCIVGRTRYTQLPQPRIPALRCLITRSNYTALGCRQEAEITEAAGIRFQFTKHLRKSRAAAGRPNQRRQVAVIEISAVEISAVRGCRAACALPPHPADRKSVV